MSGKITPPPPNYDDIASLYSLGKQLALIGGGGIEIAKTLAVLK